MFTFCVVTEKCAVHNSCVVLFTLSSVLCESSTAVTVCSPFIHINLSIGSFCSHKIQYMVFLFTSVTVEGVSVHISHSIWSFCSHQSQYRKFLFTSVTV